MRIDIDQNKGNPEPQFYWVKVDGILLQDCIMADDEQGIAEAYLIDGSGSLIPSEGPRGFETQTFRGRVRIISAAGPRPWGGEQIPVETLRRLPSPP
jgi:hypothetical protein